MDGCLMTSGYLRTCATIQKAGGLKGRVWAFNLNSADGTKLSYTESGNVVSAITVQTGEKALVIGSTKFSHDMIGSVKKPGANKFYGQEFNLRLIIDTGLDLTWSHNFVMSDAIVLVIEDMNQRFILLGQHNGLEVGESELGGFAQEAESDVSTVYSCSGFETENQFKFIDTGGGYDATLAYLQGLEVVA